MIVNVGSCAELKVFEVFLLSAGDWTLYYCSIFQHLFKFIPRYCFEKPMQPCKDVSGTKCAHRKLAFIPEKV